MTGTSTERCRLNARPVTPTKTRAPPVLEALAIMGRRREELLLWPRASPRGPWRTPAPASRASSTRALRTQSAVGTLGGSFPFHVKHVRRQGGGVTRRNATTPVEAALVRGDCRLRPVTRAPSRALQRREWPLLRAPSIKRRPALCDRCQAPVRDQLANGQHSLLRDNGSARDVSRETISRRRRVASVRRTDRETEALQLSRVNRLGLEKTTVPPSAE